MTIELVDENDISSCKGQRQKNYELLEYLKKFEREEGRPPKAEDFRNNPKYPGLTTYIRHFGSWNNALKMAGLQAKKGGTKVYTDKELLEFLRKFERENGRPPTEEDFVRNYEYPNFATYHKCFGGWNNALEMVGLQTKKGGQVCEKEHYSDNELLEYLKLYNDENGRSPTEEDFRYNPKYPSFQTYINRFGSWNKSLKMAGLYTNRFAKTTDEELLELLRKFERENGRPPKAEDFANNLKYPSCSTYIRRFGNWQKALRLVGSDTDSMVRKGIIETKQQRGRLGEILVLEHFHEKATDLSGENYISFADGICPKGEIYDVKSSKLYDSYYQFDFRNTYREDIEWFYLLGFNKDYSKLEHVWIIPGNFTDEDSMIIGIGNNYTYNVENMGEYEITEKFKDIYF